jgi:hypothetical protein
MNGSQMSSLTTAGRSLSIAAFLGLGLLGCPTANDDDSVGGEPIVETDLLTCEQCHVDQEMLLATVEPPEEPDGETEGSGEG